VPRLVFFVGAWLAGASLISLLHAHARAGGAVVPGALLAVGLVAALLAVGYLMHDARASAAAPTADTGSTVLAAFAIGVGAVAVGHGAWQADRTCLAALGDPAQSLLVRLDGDAAPGAWVRGVARADARGLHEGDDDRETRHARAACRVPVAVSVREGDAVAGAWVQVHATRLTTGQLLRLDEARVVPTGSVDWLQGWRARTGRTIDTLFAERAPLVRALLVADQQGIDVAVRDRFATAGLVHVLSISGLHVAIIAGALRTLGAALRLRRATADLIALLGVGGYVTLLGLPPPAVRAATMLAVLMLSSRLGRPVHPWTALALGVVVPTFDPRVVASLGWQLSASGMAALVGARGLMRRWRAWPLVRPASATGSAAGRLAWRLRLSGPRLSGWRLVVVQELAVGTIASIVSAPLVAWAFGRVSLVAPLANLVAAPVVTLLQPTLFLALVLAPAPAVARWVADASVWPLLLLDRIALVASEVPFAALEVAPGVVTSLCMGVLVGALVVATARRRIGPPLLVGAAAVVVAIWAPVLDPGPGQLELHMLDVGQGDALALRTPRGRWVLVDAGRTWTGGDAGRRAVVPYVRRRGGEVALFVLSHPDADHVGGAPSVLDALRPARWWDPGFVHTSDVYREALAVARRHAIPWRRAQAGDSVRIDGVLLRVLGPDSSWTAAQSSANDASAVLLVQHGRVRFLLTGDAEAAQEAWLVERWGAALEATVLKVGHHGSRTSSTPAFLDAVRPQVALISVGAGNRYGHPAPPVVEALGERGVELLRTDRDGAVVLRTDGRSLTLETQHARWTRPVP
jgi:competence protein ComEC